MEGVLLLIDNVTDTVNNAINVLSLLIPSVFVMTTTIDRLNSAINDAVNRGVTELTVVNFLGESVDIPSIGNLRINWDFPGDSVIQYLGSILLKHINLISNNALGFLAKSLLAITGDPKITLMIKLNFEINNLTKILQGTKSLVIDDIRILSFIDPGYIKPGLKIICTCGGSLSYTNNSIVVISMYSNLIRDLIKLINEGLKPSLIIVTPPTLSKDEITLKKDLLTLGIPTITIISNEGGPHIGGTLLNAIFQISHAG